MRQIPALLLLSLCLGGLPASLLRHDGKIWRGKTRNSGR